mmetsp:Transcript_36418/g.73506  ORF Transcript_36418/g.73506 Transcript_36418/m.73506 type:complete len:230 (-) Transcript_36418:177-866(-)
MNDPACLTASKGRSILARRARVLSMRFEMKRGYSRSRMVWPVGAVSITILSNWIVSPMAVLASPSSTSDITLLRATSSSAPGGATSKISVISDSPSFAAMLSASLPFSPSSTRRNSATASSRSTSSAYRFPPCSATGVTLPPERSAISASPRECAGSVEITSVRRPSSANLIAIAALVLVFPTPPFPPTKTYLRPGRSTRRLRPSSPFPRNPMHPWVACRERPFGARQR